MSTLRWNRQHVRNGSSEMLKLTVELQVQDTLIWLFQRAISTARGCFGSQQRLASLSDGKSTVPLHCDGDAKCSAPKDFAAPCIMHMGDYLMMMNSISDLLPSSVYQAFPQHLLARAYYVQHTLSSLGAITSPSFLCHPLVTPASIRALFTSGGLLLALEAQLCSSQPPCSPHPCGSLSVSVQHHMLAMQSFLCCEPAFGTM